MEAWRQAHPSFRPYWDPTLAADRSKRLELYRVVASKGLLVLRKRINSRCGIFFVWKSGHKGIRLIIDAREAHACHRRPPRAFLGSASAIGELQISSEIGSFAEVKVPLPEGGHTVRKEPQTSDGAVGDVSDAFYKHMSQWYGLDDALEPWEIGLEDSYEHGRCFLAFSGMPPGWTWASFFCQSAVQHCGERALGPGRSLVQGRLAPDLRQGPICST